MAFNLTANLVLKGPKGITGVITRARDQLKKAELILPIKITFPKDFDTKVTTSVKSLKTLQDRLKKLRRQSDRAYKSLETFTACAKAASKATTGLAKSSTKASTTSKKVASSMRRATNSIEEFGRVAGLAIRRYAGFTIATTITFGLIRATQQAASETIKFERELIKVAQVSDRSVKSLGSLRKEIDILATGFGTSSTSLIEVSRTLAQAGLTASSTRQALRALALTTLAPTFDDITKTTEGAIAIMRQFSIQANELEGVLGSLNAVAGGFAVESSDLIAAIRRVGGVFSAAGASIGDKKGPTQRLNELVALFTSVRATTRESAESIATGLRTIFTRIQRGSTINALRKLGIELQDTEGNFIGVFQAVGALSKGLSSLPASSTQFNQILEQLGGFRQISKTIPLILKFKTAQEALNVATKGQTSLQEDAQQALDGLGVRLDQTRERFLKLVREFVISDEFKRITGVILDLADAFIVLVDSIKSVLPLLTSLVAVRGLGALATFGRGFGRGSGILGRNQGGSISRLQGGGQNRFRDTLLTPGEMVVLPKQVKNIGLKNLQKLNNSENILSVPGVGNTDSVRQSLPVGSFVLKKRSVAAITDSSTINRNRGGSIGRFQDGGSVEAFSNNAGVSVVATALVATLALFGRNLLKAGRGLSAYNRTLADSRRVLFAGTPIANRNPLRTGLKVAGLPNIGTRAGRAALGGRVGLLAGAVGLAASSQGGVVGGGAGGGLLAGGIGAAAGAGPAGVALLAVIGTTVGALDGFRKQLEELRLNNLRLATDDLTQSFRDLQAGNISFNEINRDLDIFVDSITQGAKDAAKARKFTPLGVLQNTFGNNEVTSDLQAAISELGTLVSTLVTIRGFLEGFGGIDNTPFFGARKTATDTFRSATRTTRFNDANAVFAELADQIPSVTKAVEDGFKQGRGLNTLTTGQLSILGSANPQARARVRERFSRGVPLKRAIAEEFARVGRPIAESLKDTFNIENIIQNTTRQLDFMSERLKNLGAVAQRAGELAPGFQNRRFGIEQGLSTAPVTGKTSTRISTLLGNLRGASPAEFESSLKTIQNITGGGFPDLENVFRGLKNLEKAFPDIITRASQAPFGQNKEALKSGISNVIPVGSLLSKRLEAQVDQFFGTRGKNADIADFAKEINLPGLFDEIQNILGNIAKEFESASQDFVNSLDQAAKFQRQANTSKDAAANIRLRSLNQQRQLTGRTLSLRQLNDPFNEQQSRLARGGGIRGSQGVDPRFLRSAIVREQSSAEERRRNLTSAIQAGNAGDVFKFGNKLRESQDRLGALNQALQNLATSTEIQNNIQKKLSENQQRRSGRNSFINQFFGGGAEGRRKTLVNAAAGRLALERGNLSSNGARAQQELAGIEAIRNVNQQGGNASALQRIDQFRNAQFQGLFPKDGVFDRAFGGLPKQDRRLREGLEDANNRRADANASIGGLRGSAVRGIRRGGAAEFEARTDVLDKLKALDDSFAKAAAAIGDASNNLSTNVTAVAAQLANVNIPSEITFTGTINEGRPVVVSLAGQDALTTRITDEIATRVEEIIRERINERTIPNLMA